MTERETCPRCHRPDREVRECCLEHGHWRMCEDCYLQTHGALR